MDQNRPSTEENKNDDDDHDVQYRISENISANILRCRIWYNTIGMSIRTGNCPSQCRLYPEDSQKNKHA